MRIATHVLQPSHLRAHHRVCQAIVVVDAQHEALAVGAIDAEDDVSAVAQQRQPRVLQAVLVLEHAPRGGAQDAKMIAFHARHPTSSGGVSWCLYMRKYSRWPRASG